MRLLALLALLFFSVPVPAQMGTPPWDRIVWSPQPDDGGEDDLGTLPFQEDPSQRPPLNVEAGDTSHQAMGKTAGPEGPMAPTVTQTKTILPGSSNEVGGVVGTVESGSLGSLTLTEFSDGTVIADASDGTDCTVTGTVSGDRVNIGANCNVTNVGQGGTVNATMPNCSVGIANTSMSKPTYANLPGGLKLTVNPGSTVSFQT